MSKDIFSAFACVHVCCAGVHGVAVCTCVLTFSCAPDGGCLFFFFYDVCFFSLPGPGAPVRTPRRPCACLPKTSASPGPPRGRGQPNVIWSLYRVVSGGQEEADGMEEGGEGGGSLKRRMCRV